MSPKELRSISPAELATAEEQLAQQLRQLGMHRSKQKRAILMSLLRVPQPVSAKELLYLVKQEDLFTSFGTVHRTLRTMVACGLAEEEIDGDGVTRYVLRSRKEVCLHEHQRCADCGAEVSQ